MESSGAGARIVLALGSDIDYQRGPCEARAIEIGAVQTGVA